MRKVKERSYFFDFPSGISVILTFCDDVAITAEVMRPCDDRSWYIGREAAGWDVPKLWPEHQRILNILKFMEEKEARYARYGTPN